MLTVQKNGRKLRKLGATVTMVKVSNKRNRRRRRPSGLISSRSSAFSAYCNTLEDPWEYPPVRLGWGCFVSTVLGTGYYRNAVQVNADGSFAIAVAPQIVGGVLTSNAGANTATWSQLDFANRAALQGQGTEARIVSGGIRCFALFPETSAPGVLFAGSISGRSTGSMIGFTPTVLTQAPNATLGIGSKGARVVIRPEDPSSYSFSTTPVGGSTTTAYPTTTGWIAGLGFPASTVIWYEVILNLEMTPLETTASIGINEDAVPSDGGLTDAFPSMEKMWSSVKSVLGNAAIMDGAASVASMHSPMLGAAIRGASALGSGRHFARTQLVAGANAANQGRQGRILIEEMKDDF